jgi:DNA-binding transcriptional LysR family regulator
MQWEKQIGRRIRLKDLHTLQTVAEAGSMAKAADRLAMSQPAISKAIADLEHVLGASLFDRSSSGVELTECGHLLLERTRVIFDEVRQGISDIEHASDPSRGEVRIGTNEPMTGVVAEIIAKLVSKYPRITCAVTVSDTDTLARDLRERRVDLLLTRWIPALIAEDLTATLLFQSPFAVMAEKSHRVFGRKKLRLADLMDERWVLSPNDSFLGRIVTDIFRRQDLPLPHAVVTSISISLRLNLLATGRFLSVLPTSVLGPRSSKAWLAAVNVDLGDNSSPIAAIALAKRQPSGAARLFLQASVEVCKNMAKPVSAIATAPPNEDRIAHRTGAGKRRVG